MWEERFIDWVLRRRLIVLVTAAVVTGAAGFFATQVQFDSDIEVWFLEDDPGLVAYREFLERFEADEITVMGVFADDIFTPEVIAALARVTAAAEEAPHVHRVTSLTNVEIATGSEGTIEITPLMGRVPATRRAAEELRRLALRSRLLVGALVSADAKGTAVIVEMDPAAQDFARKVEMVTALTEIARREAPTVDIRLAGTPPLDDAFYRYTVRDFMTFGPACLLLVVMTILVAFRRVSAVLVPLAVVGLSLVWLFGLMGLLDRRIDVVATALPAVILAVGVADTLHVLSDFYRELAAGHGRNEAVRHSIGGLMVPCLVTSGTTAAGMLSLLVSDLRPVQQFGWLTAVGVLFAFVLSMTVAPVLLTWVQRPDAEFLARQQRGAIARLLGWLGAPSRRRSWVVVAVSLVIVGLAVWQAAYLEVGTNTMNYFKSGDPIRLDTELVDERLGGTAAVEFLVHAPNEGLKEPAILSRLDRLERRLEEFDGISKVLSIVDQLKEMNSVLTGDDVYLLPDSRAKTAQFYLLLEGEEDFETVVQDNYSVGRITARVKLSKSQDLAHAVPALEKELAEDFADADLQVSATGYIKLMSDMEAYLLRSQIRSFFLAFCIIVVIIGLLLRSARLALFSMIPNFIPIAIGIGFMSTVGIPLDPGTVMIGSIALGLVVDDTIHFLVRLRREVRDGHDLEEAIRRAVQIAGRPIIITSLALIAGFLVLTLGSFTPNIDFGLVTATIVLLALTADLLALPAALILIRPRL